MAQYNFTKEIESNYETTVESTDVMTGGRDQSRFLYYQLKMSMLKAKGIDIIVSFLMESGIRMILNDIRNALDRGVPVRILTGNYLGITQPSALYLIRRELGNRIDLRFYNDKRRSFHPKAYIFHHSIIIDDDELRRYSKNWHKPAIAKDLAKYDHFEEGIDTKVELLFQPRGIQIEALCALEDSRAEGASKGLVQAATGVGKTYLAAFDSAKFNRVLFVAHREEILKQAAASFRNVRKSEDYGFFTESGRIQISRLFLPPLQHWEEQSV